MPADLAERVAGHLVMAGQLVDEDAELAYAHAEAARRRAARLPIVREATAETAYAAGHFDVALREFRALRRMTGTHDYLPVMADCERALGRPQAALKLARESDQFTLDPALRIEMIIVEAGARRDLGQLPEALRVLQRAVGGVAGGGESSRVPVARLHFAYAEALLGNDDQVEARRWLESAADIDRDGETGAQERLDELDGFMIDFDDSESEVDESEVDESEDDESEDDEPEDVASADDLEEIDSDENSSADDRESDVEPQVADSADDHEADAKSEIDEPADDHEDHGSDEADN